MRVFNQNRKEKTLLAIGSVIYLLLIFLNEVLFVLEYLFKSYKMSSRVDCKQKEAFNQKKPTKHSAEKFFANFSAMDNYHPSNTANQTRKSGIQKPIPIHIYSLTVKKQIIN